MTTPLILHVFSTFRVGGPQVRFAALANHYGRKYRHLILAMDGSYECMQRLDPTVEVQTCSIAVRKRNTIPNILRFRRLLQSWRPDLLMTYNWGAIEWAMANRPLVAPHVHTEDGFGPEEIDRQLWRRVVMRRLALTRSVVIVPSRKLQNLALNAWRLRPHFVRYVPNGIDCDRFAVDSNPIAVPPGTGPIIGTVGALRQEKNIHRLLRAFRRVREKVPCRLLIVGDGPMRGELERSARCWLPQESLLFSGHITAVERAYASFDIFAISSDTEQMPTSLMEAMASGLPVVSTDVGDVTEMLTANNRPFVVAPDDGAFADALYRLIRDAQLRAQLGTENRIVAKDRFAVSRMFRTYDLLFSFLVNCEPGSLPLPTGSP